MTDSSKDLIKKAAKQERVRAEQERKNAAQREKMLLAQAKKETRLVKDMKAHCFDLLRRSDSSS